MRDSNCISRQRAQNITHKRLRQERLKVRQALADAEHAKHVHAQVERRRFREEGVECESLVLKRMALRTKQDVSAMSIHDSLLCDYFHTTVQVKHLQGFIRCRDEKYQKKANFPAKGKLIDAEAGKDCLLKLAFDRREKPIILAEEKALPENAPAVYDSINSGYY